MSSAHDDPFRVDNEIVPLIEARAESRFGGKSASLARAIEAGLPVPDGFAISARAVAAIEGGDGEAVEYAARSYREKLGCLAAVRSSAVGEDGAAASFAGQHATILGVLGQEQFLAAIAKVHASGMQQHALVYRVQMGLASQEPKVAITVQRLIDPRVAGVMFTRNPVTGAHERIVEAAFGLGEVVVASLVTPDTIRFEKGGSIVDYSLGYKSLSHHPLEGGGILVRHHDDAGAERPCLDGRDIGKLDKLAADCERLYGQGLDIEWGFAGDELFLLQCRPITRMNDAP
ncbi:MAG TPA: PEP/pyruvate-binding domain-containing protein [Parvibaculum sp.]